MQEDATPYPKRPAYHFTLESIGAPELWVEFRDPWGLPGAEFQRIQKVDAIVMRLQRDRATFIPADDEWALTAFDEFLRSNLLAWNLYDPTDEDLPLEQRRVLPVKGDDPSFDPFAPLPEEVIFAIAKEVKGRLLSPPAKSPT